MLEFLLTMGGPTMGWGLWASTAGAPAESVQGLLGPGAVDFLVFSLALILGVLFSVWRRAFYETPSAHFFRRFKEWKVPENFDQAEKLRRVHLILAVFTQLTRILWITVFLKLFTGSILWTELSWKLPVLIVAAILLFDVLPQVFATWRGEKIALRSLRFLCSLETLFSPLSQGLRSVTRSLLRLFGNGNERKEADIVEEGIRAAVEHGERQGVLFAGEKSMIESVLEFHDAEVTEVMTPRTEMVAAEATTTIEEMVQKAISCGHSRIPVYRDNIDNIVGIVYTKDLLRYANDARQSQLQVEEILRRIYFVPESKKIRELLAEFRAERFHIAVVLDEYGGTTGLVTIEDILEEIVGEIEDEYDAAGAAMIRRVDSSTFDLDGRAHIDDVSKALSHELPQSDDYETIAGFVFSSLGKVPKEGESFDLGALRFKITAADERKIKRVRVELLAVPGQEVA